MKRLSIGEVARRAGLQTSAIRYYESVGLLPVPERESGHRRYEPDVLNRLELIQLARQADFSIRDLQLLFSEVPEMTKSAQWQALAAEKIAEMEVLIAHAQGIRRWLLEARHCRCIEGESCSAHLLNPPTLAYDSRTNKKNYVL